MLAFTSPRDTERDHDVHKLEAEDPAPLLIAAADDPPLREGRVQVDHVRHHGGAEDADRQQHRLLAVEGGRQSTEHVAATRLGEHHLRPERQQDDRHEARDQRLKAPHAALLQPEDQEGDHGGDQRGGEQRNPEQQIDRDRRAKELRQIAGHR